MVFNQVSRNFLNLFALVRECVIRNDYEEITYPFEEQVRQKHLIIIF